MAPEYPTIAEIVSGFDVFTFFAVAAGTPDEIVARIEKAAVGLGNDPSVREHLAAIAAEAVGFHLCRRHLVLGAGAGPLRQDHHRPRYSHRIVETPSAID